MSTPLPLEILDQIAHSLIFDELWRVRNVNFRWNEIALQRARALLYADSAVYLHVEIGVREFGKIRTRVPIKMYSQHTDGKPDTDTLTWHSWKPISVYPAGEHLYIDWCSWWGVNILLPRTDLKWLCLDYFPPFLLLPADNGSKHGEQEGCSVAIPSSEVGTIQWMLPKKDDDPERSRFADWLIQGRVLVGSENEKALDACIKLKLWQLVGLFLKRNPFESSNGDNSEDEESGDHGSEDDGSEDSNSEDCGLDWLGGDSGSEDYESEDEESEEEWPLPRTSDEEDCGSSCYSSEDDESEDYEPGEYGSTEEVSGDPSPGDPSYTNSRHTLEKTLP